MKRYRACALALPVSVALSALCISPLMGCARLELVTSAADVPVGDSVLGLGATCEHGDAVACYRLWQLEPSPEGRRAVLERGCAIAPRADTAVTIATMCAGAARLEQGPRRTELGLQACRTAAIEACVAVCIDTRDATACWRASHSGRSKAAMRTLLEASCAAGEPGACREVRGEPEPREPLSRPRPEGSPPILSIGALYSASTQREAIGGEVALTFPRGKKDAPFTFNPSLGVYAHVQEVDGDHARLGLGPELFFGPIGLEVGLELETANAAHSSTAAFHFAPFLSFGYLSVALRVAEPFDGSGRAYGGEAGIAVAVKLPFYVRPR